MPDRTGPANPSSTLAKVLGLIALLAVVWSVVEGVRLGSLSEPLRTASAPRRLVSLALAPSTTQAQQILTEWHCLPAPRQAPCTVAEEALSRDTWFIVAYVFAWALVAVWSSVAGGVSRNVVAAICAVLLFGGLVDLAENWLLALIVGGADRMPFAWMAPLVPRLMGYVQGDITIDAVHVFTLARVAAMTKFVSLLAGIAAAVIVAGGALRLFFGAKRVARDHAEKRVDPDSPTLSGFAELITRETQGIFDGGRGGAKDSPVCHMHKASDEPFVTFREADIIGISLSGGGIRSATFNLGLLQGLDRVGLLHLFDYLSTVSGGGYVGSFWSAWLARRKEQPGTPEWKAQLFPRPTSKPSGDRVESDEERHLREFSGFLAPRWGFFEVETWTAIVALLAGLVPALLVGLSVLGVTLIAWLSFTFPLASRKPEIAMPFAIGIISAAVLYAFEKMWQEFKRESAGHVVLTTPENDRKATAHGARRYVQFAAAAVILLVGLQYWWVRSHEVEGAGAWAIYRYALTGAWFSAPEDSGLVRWWVLTGIDNPGRPWLFSPRIFDYGVVWLIGSLLLVFARATSAVAPRPWPRETLAAFDRVLMRVLGMAFVWVGLSLLWHFAINLESLLSAAVAAAISGGIFAALRNWIGVTLRRPSEAGMMDRLKPVLPSLLAYLTVVLTTVTLGAVLVHHAGADWFAWWMATATMTIPLVLASFITPDEFGLHAFYRDRISRAYAGASNLEPGEHAADNRGSEPRDDDDLPFVKLRSRPLQLVCCAANDLSGDQVETLSRGARSAVLSKHGFSIGPYAHDWDAYSPGNRLGSGITASAAAFNSNMGQISVRVGPAVSFLMTMLNLRLGLWVRHPLARRAGFRRWPGILYYREMFALTSSSGRMPADMIPKSVLRDIHLSDGGHFENLAFYELIRRHCRYIILSDCGADPEVAFDDLGNALRRVREDFGVDVELDVAPLRRGPDGNSRQHVAVGTIRYPSGDAGILLYVKPTVTGDEPPDVQQYRTRNTAFPNESTTDQFYDEAQWESYRRLGLHAAQQIFAFVEQEDSSMRDSADRVFAEASQRWGPTPEGLEERVLEMTKRFGQLDAELQQRRAYGMLSDLFPELESLPEEAKRADAVAAKADAAQVAGPTDAEAVLAAEISLLLRVTQLMEDVWLACELDRWWLHPLNLGWINLFARWATSPRFRFWWPLMGPMFSPGFRRFIQHRYPARKEGTDEVVLPQKGTVVPIAEPRDSGLAALWWEHRSVQALTWKRDLPAGFSRIYYQNLLALPRDGGDVQIQAGLAGVTLRAKRAGWTSDDFFVPPSLWGAGIGWYFLEGLLAEVGKHAAECYVVVKAPPPGQANQVARDDRRAFVEQYKKIGFREVQPDDERKKSLDMELCRALNYAEAEDTLLTRPLP